MQICFVFFLPKKVSMTTRVMGIGLVGVVDSYLRDAVPYALVKLFRLGFPTHQTWYSAFCLPNSYIFVTWTVIYNWKWQPLTVRPSDRIYYRKGNVCLVFLYVSCHMSLSLELFVTVGILWFLNIFVAFQHILQYHGNTYNKGWNCSPFCGLCGLGCTLTDTCIIIKF